MSPSKSRISIALIAASLALCLGVSGCKPKEPATMDTKPAAESSTNASGTNTSSTGTANNDQTPPPPPAK